MTRLYESITAMAQCQGSPAKRMRYIDDSSFITDSMGIVIPRAPLWHLMLCLYEKARYGIIISSS